MFGIIIFFVLCLDVLGTISEIRHLLGGVYLDIRVDIVPE